MKKMIKKITTGMAAAALLLGCSVDNNVIDDVFEKRQKGAFLRTTATTSLTFNAFDPASTFDITVEEQDEQGGDLLESVDVYFSFEDNQGDPDDNSKPEVLVTTIPASDFVVGPFGLPETSISVSLGDAATTLGLADGDYTGGDTFNIRLELNLTDGRTYTDTNANGNIAALGGYYSSPYAYSAGVACIPINPIPGDYTLDLVDTYGDGWDGAFITVTIDGVSTDYTVDTTDNLYVVNVPDGTTELVFTYSPGNFEEEHVFEILAPNGDVAATSPGVAGEIVLNICV